MKRFLVCALFLLAATPALSAQEVEYKGRLEPELKLSSGMGMLLLTPATEAEMAQLPAKLKEGEQAFAGKLVLSRKNKVEPTIYLIEQKAGESSLYVDQNLNGKIDTDERLAFAPVKENDKEYGEVLLKFPLATGPYKFYPYRIRWQKDAPPLTGKTMEGKRALLVTFDVLAQGSAEVKGRKVLLQYGFSFDNASINPMTGRLGVDGDGDGKIDNSFVSPENAYAKNETVVFRVGDAYISTKSVDAATGDIILRSHTAAEYPRIEFKMGAELPDYSFTDFDAKARKLSDFRGKYLLIDFWGTWCGPCVAEIPHLKEAYEKYRSRGFEILGMDFDPANLSSEKPMTDEEKAAAKKQALDKVKKFMTDKGMTWTQATTDSIQELLDKRFRITAYPTTVLLDPQGKIISLGQRDQMRLRGKELFDTLEKLMPASAAEKPAKSASKN